MEINRPSLANLQKVHECRKEGREGRRGWGGKLSYSISSHISQLLHLLDENSPRQKHVLRPDRHGREPARPVLHVGQPAPHLLPAAAPAVRPGVAMEARQDAARAAAADQVK